MELVPVYKYHYKDFDYFVLGEFITTSLGTMLYVCDINTSMRNRGFKSIIKNIHDVLCAPTVKQYITFEKAIDLIKKSVFYMNTLYHLDIYSDTNCELIIDAVSSFYRKYYIFINCLKKTQLKWKEIYTKKATAAITIQRIWRKLIVDPKKLICRKRLYREFAELQ